MQNRQIDKKTTKQVRIDINVHKHLKIQATKEGVSIKALLEGYIGELLNISIYKNHHKN